MTVRAPAGLAAIALACAAPADEPAGEHAAAIIGGTFDEGDGAVVGLSAGDRELFCTGTLVSPHVVLSAAHCVADGAVTLVYFGADPAAGGAFVPIASAQAHPGFSWSSLDDDISVVVLADAAPAGVTPVPAADRAPWVGQTARFVGFGFTAVGQRGDYGRKYELSTDLTSVDATTFEYGVATCNGDSGGPAFVTVAGREVLAGITSWGDDNCSQFGVDTRVDAYASWYAGFLDQHDPPTCAADGRCAAACAAPDPDCPCAADGLCTAACADVAADPDCPPECAAEGTCRQDCPLRDADCPITPVDGECASDFECGDNVCQGVCRPLCDPAAPACAPGLSCLDAGEGTFACLTPPEEGGCAVAGRRASWGGLLLALALAAIARRRRGAGKILAC